LAGAVALEAAALACYSTLTMQMLRPVRNIRFGTVLRIDLAVYGLTRVLPAAPVSGAALRLRLLTAAGLRPIRSSCSPATPLPECSAGDS
jgi:uncharacterized membrane protein YbhN (UPF0104 family)